MKIEIDSFSGNKIYPGRGTLFVRGDSKIFRFYSSKTASLFKQRKNPRRIAWTVLYRRKHKKGITEEVAKKRSRKSVKSARGIVGASLDVIKEKRNARPDARQATRAKHAEAATERKEKEAERRKAAKAAHVAAGGPKVSKLGAKGSAPKVQATSR